MSNRKTKEQFIEEAQQIHGDKYDYLKVEYVNYNTKVIIICKEHGDFLQIPKTHLLGSGCKTCYNELRGKKNKKDINHFLQKAKEKHGDKYNYSKVEYTNCKKKIIIICKEHGEFLQTPTDHYNGDCKKCADILRNNNRRFTTEELIQKAKEIHGDTYDYSNTLYDGKKLNIICKIHGEFQQLMNIHINQKGGCKKCGDILRGKNRRFTTEGLIEKAKEIHGDKYDYSNMEYNGIYNKIKIICREHGEFLQTPSSHIRGGGCQKCYDNRRGESIRKTTEEFIINSKKIHGDIYDYSKSNYISIDDKVIIICKKHGEFNQVAYSHTIGLGCWECGVIKRSETKRSNTEEFIERARNKHGDKYDYLKVEYVKYNTKVIIICKEHGDFLQTPNSHLQGAGCPLCINKTEGKIYNEIQKYYPSIIQQFKQEWCKNINCLPFDFCIPEHNIIIELDGRQHFEIVNRFKNNPEEQQKIDKYKEQQANENNYSIIRILQEDVYYDTYDWCKELCDTIEEIKNGDEIVNYYLCKNDEYKDYY
jgi:very-short-patch-repair endonuclease